MKKLVLVILLCFSAQSTGKEWSDKDKHLYTAYGDSLILFSYMLIPKRSKKTSFGC